MVSSLQDGRISHSSLSRSAKDLTLGAFVLGVSAAAVFIAVDREFILDAMDICRSDPKSLGCCTGL